MKKCFGISLLALAVAFPLGLAAEEEKAEDTFLYATYFYCNTGTQDKVDDIVKANTAPIYDAAVADGTIKGWGWMSHHTGGKWRRIQYHSSSSVAGLLATQKSLGDKVDAAGGDPDNEFGKICSAHDDYIWKVEAGGAGTVARGSASLSVYMVCSFSGEDRADEIVKSVFAPVYDKAVADGKLTSWGWMSHVVGGKYRRLSTMSADNYDDLLAARGEILDALYGDGENAQANEFSEICGSHSDYLWDVVHEKP
jgi:hypothetical protein